MNSTSTSTPDPRQPPPAPPRGPEGALERTPFDASDEANRAALEAKALEAKALEAKMALLPDYAAEAFPVRSSRRSRPGAAGAGSETSGNLGARAEPGEPSLVAPAIGGFLGGALANMALGFVLLALQRAGAALDGAGVIAVVVAVVILALAVGSWPRRVWACAGGFVVGLVLSFAALVLFVRPLLDQDASATRAPIAAPDLPPDQSGTPS